MTNTPTGAVLPGGFLDLFQAGLAANLPTAANFPNALNRTAFYYATDTGVLYKYNPSTNVWDAGDAKVQTVGAALTAAGPGTYLLSAVAGSVLTLPAATGSGIKLKVLVSATATSNAHKVLTSPITDVLVGQAVGGVVAGTNLKFNAVTASAFHSLQMPFAGTQPSGGFEGDVFDLTDMAAGKWHVEGMYQSGTTATTPFSTATT